MSNRYIYKHVAIIGLDGMGSFNKNTPTPHMDEIFANGAKTYDAISLFPTISAQNWGAMLLGTDPEVHGLTNGIVSREEYKNKELPSIFTTVRKAMPDSVLCSISDWNPINHGIIEHDIGAELQTADNGTQTTDKVVECVLTKKPTLLFVQNDDPDGAGHHNGYGTEGHLDCITYTDGQVNRIYEAYREAGILEDTLFIVITDHGGFDHGHGGYHDGEKYIYFALTGKTVKKNEGFFAQTKDINAIVRHAFGIEIPAFNREGYSSQVPAGIFTDSTAPYISQTPARFDIENRPTPAIDGKDGLYSFFPREDVKLAMFFDNDLSDATGNFEFKEINAVKFYSTGIRGAMAEFGTTGYLVNDDIRFGNESFTVACWLKVDDAPGGRCMVCATKRMDESGAGFSIFYNKAGVFAGLETKDKSTYLEVMVPYYHDVSGGWIHTAVSFDKKDMEIRIYCNFELKKTVKLADIYSTSVDELPFTIGEDASHSINQESGYIFNTDDLFIFNKAFRNEDIAALKAYYGI